MDAIWRTDRRNPRVVYAVIGDEASDDDVMIGSLDTGGLAQRAVDDHNYTLVQTRFRAALREGV